jgi:hypothetical protein
MYLSEMRQFAARIGLQEAVCRACPPEDWAPACSACGDSRRVWVGEDVQLSDEELVSLHRQPSRLRAHG